MGEVKRSRGFSLKGTRPHGWRCTICTLWYDNWHQAKNCCDQELKKRPFKGGVEKHE